MELIIIMEENCQFCGDQAAIKRVHRANEWIFCYSCYDDFYDFADLAGEYEGSYFVM